MKISERISLRSPWQHKPVREPKETLQPEMQLGSPNVRMSSLKFEIFKDSDSDVFLKVDFSDFPKDEIPTIIEVNTKEGRFGGGSGERFLCKNISSSKGSFEVVVDLAGVTENTEIQLIGYKPRGLRIFSTGFSRVDGRQA